LTRALVDANVFLYALGGEHPYRKACRKVVAALRARELRGEITVEIVQEVVHVRRRRGTDDAAERGRDMLSWRLPLHSFEPPDLDRALKLLRGHPALSARDAVHAATALNRRIEAIISTDTHFDAVAGLTRVDPADREAVSGLMAEQG
jgi:uncharacterized protein